MATGWIEISKVQRLKVSALSLDNGAFLVSLRGLTMTDPRYTKLARLLVEYSIGLKKGERVLIDATDVPDEFAVELMRAIRRAGGVPLIEVRHTRIAREVMRETDFSHASVVRDVDEQLPDDVIDLLRVLEVGQCSPLSTPPSQ